MPPTIAVLIPAINEQAHIGSAVQSAVLGGASEVIVADGGSVDQTEEIAAASGARVLRSTPGRGVQMNFAARQSMADVLLFLHADNRLPNDFVGQIQNAITNPQTQAGVFRQQIEGSSPFLRVLAWGNEKRVRWRNLAYGDQGIWVRRAIYEELGGFPEVPLMEDYIFSERLRKKFRFAILPGPLAVSSRRWQQRGIVGQTLLNWRIIAAYKRGHSLDELSSLYRRHDK